MEKSSRPTRSPATLMVKIPSSTTTICAAAGAARHDRIERAPATDRRQAGVGILQMYPRGPARSRWGREDGYNPACPPSPVPSSV